MKGLVLSGGKGTRLRPLTYTMGKQLIPVGNRPIICYPLQHILDAGIRDIGVVISPETGSQVREAIASWFPTLDITYILQEQPLGLAHAVKVASPFLKDSSFVMYLGDSLIGEGISGLLSEFQSSNADVVVLLKQVPEPSRFGVALVDDEGSIQRFVEKPREHVSDLALVGVYCFSAAVHEAVESITPSWRDELEITDAIQFLLEKGHRVIGKRLETWWLDCGKKDDLLEANRVVLDEWNVRNIGGDVDQVSKIQGRVVVKDGATIIRSEIRGPSIIGKDTVVSGSFIGPYTSVGEECRIEESVLENCVVFDRVTIEGVARVEDSVIGRNAVVRRSFANREAIRLMIGDDTVVDL